MSYHGVTRIIGSGGVWEWRSGGVEELKSGGMKSLVPENFCIISKSVHPASRIPDQTDQHSPRGISRIREPVT